SDIGNRVKFMSELSSCMRCFKPDLVIWHKDDGCDLSEQFVAGVASSAVLVYHDMDAWHRVMKPTHRNQHVLSRYAKRVFLVGLGENANQFPEARKRIRYLPHGYCDIDLPTAWPQRERKLLFVANVSRRFGRILGPLAPEQQPG